MKSKQLDSLHGAVLRHRDISTLHELVQYYDTEMSRYFTSSYYDTDCVLQKFDGPWRTAIVVASGFAVNSGNGEEEEGEDEGKSGRKGEPEIAN